MEEWIFGGTHCHSRMASNWSINRILRVHKVSGTYLVWHLGNAPITQGRRDYYLRFRDGETKASGYKGLCDFLNLTQLVGRQEWGQEGTLASGCLLNQEGPRHQGQLFAREICAAGKDGAGHSPGRIPHSAGRRLLSHPSPTPSVSCLQTGHSCLCRSPAACVRIPGPCLIFLICEWLQLYRVAVRIRANTRIGIHTQIYVNHTYMYTYRKRMRERDERRETV